MATTLSKRQRTRIRGTSAEIAPLYRTARIVPSTFNRKARTVEVVWSTGALSRQVDELWGEPFLEELGLMPAEVDLGRLNNGGPLMDSHGRPDYRVGGSGLRDVIGVVVDGTALVNGAEGRATVRFGVRKEIQWVVDEVEAGTFRNLSMGYWVRKYAPAGERDGVPILRAVDWEPFELSLLPVGDDAGARVRAATEKTLCTLLPERTDMDEDELIEDEEPQGAEDQGDENSDEPQGTEGHEGEDNGEDGGDLGDVADDAASAAAAPAGAVATATRGKRGGRTRAGAAAAKARPDLTVDGVHYVRMRAPSTQGDRSAAAIRKGERFRVAKITELGKLLPEATRAKAVEDAIKGETSLANFRALVTDTLAKAEGNTATMNGRVTVTHEDGDKRTSSIANALAYRCGARERNATTGAWDPVKLTEGGREFVGLRLLDIGREVLRMHGQRIASNDPRRLATQVLRFRAGEMGRSDFPGLLEDAAGKTLRSAYEGARRTFPSWTNRFLATDFKPIKRLQVGEGSQMVELPEGAKMNEGTIGESKETYVLLDYARRYNLSRKAVINDDLDAFARLPRMFGNKAAQLESDLVYAHLLSNPTMSDGNPLFDAAHGNTITTALGVAGLNDARVKMRNQTEVDGQRINLEGAILIVPSELELTAGQIVADITPDSPTNANPLARTIDRIEIEPRLSATDTNDWFLSCRPSECDTIEYAYLVGEEGPQIETVDDPDTLGISIRIWEAFGVGAIDWRGLVKSTVA